MPVMKHLLLTTIAAVLVVGCGESQPPKPPTAKAPDISIHFAARKGNIEAIKQHLAAGTDVNTKDGSGSTPLHNAALGGGNQNAAHGGQKEIAELLIAKGADVNTKNELGETPLDWVLWCMQPKIADLLRKHGGKTGEELKAEGK
jgi:ankyrin repeat protein